MAGSAAHLSSLLIQREQGNLNRQACSLCTCEAMPTSNRYAASSAALQADLIISKHAAAPPLTTAALFIKVCISCKVMQAIPAVLQWTHFWSRASSDGTRGSAEHAVRRLLGTKQAPLLASACCLRYTVLLCVTFTARRSCAFGKFVCVKPLSEPHRCLHTMCCCSLPALSRSGWQQRSVSAGAQVGRHDATGGHGHPGKLPSPLSGSLCMTDSLTG